MASGGRVSLIESLRDGRDDFEQLEARVLLSADSLGFVPVDLCPDMHDEQAVIVELMPGGGVFGSLQPAWLQARGCDQSCFSAEMIESLGVCIMANTCENAD